MTGARQALHASCVAGPRGGALILGASGAGKSALALALACAGFGARLVADDQTIVWRAGGHVAAAAAAALRGMVEARGVGVLTAPAFGPTLLRLVVDLDAAAGARLPARRTRDVLGVALPVIAPPAATAAATVAAVLAHGPPLDPDAPVAVPVTVPAAAPGEAAAGRAP